MHALASEGVGGRFHYSATVGAGASWSVYPVASLENGRLGWAGMPRTPSCAHYWGWIRHMENPSAGSLATAQLDQRGRRGMQSESPSLRCRGRYVFAVSAGADRPAQAPNTVIRARCDAFHNCPHVSILGGVGRGNATGATEAATATAATHPFCVMSPSSSS